MSFRVRVLIAVAIAVAAAAGAAALLVGGEQDSIIHWVALGDSYAAGEGLGPYVDENCRRSLSSYPDETLRILGHPASVALVNEACGGATALSALADGQLRSLGADTDLVTVTIGGNDLGFTELIVACTISSVTLTTPCGLDGERAADRVAAAADGVAALLTAAVGRAPGADVVVLGYPAIIGEREFALCADLLGPAERDRAADLALDLDHALAGVAADAGAVYISLVAAFEGHSVCSQEPWINPFVFDLGGAVGGVGSTASYHPNVDGVAVYARALAPIVAQLIEER